MHKLTQMYWLHILVGGIFLFSGAFVAAAITRNTNFYPTVMLVGASVVPVTFVTYFYNYVRHRDISLPVLTACGVVGGVLGLLAAGLLEFAALRNLGPFQLVGISLIEEAVKLIFPIGMYIHWKYRHEADGLLFGVAAGMGFAALETMGYSLTQLIRAHGEVNILGQVLILRGLLSPAGHAAWTGLVCAALWRKRERSNRFVNLSVIGTFIVAVGLHTVWNAVSFSNPNSPNGALILIVGFTGIGAISLALLIARFRMARRSAIEHDVDKEASFAPVLPETPLTPAEPPLDG